LPLFYQHNINETTRLAVWKIEEPESFFLSHIASQRAIQHPQKRLQHLAGRFLLSFLFPDFPIAEILLADTRKPYLAHHPYHFSISHCTNYAAAIVSRTEKVGIDIEVPTERVLKIRHKFLHPTEQAMFNSSHQLVDQTTLLWSAKEAMFKWWGWAAVDFSEMLRIEAFELATEGLISARLVTEQGAIRLPLNYKLMPNLCLVWANKLENAF